jgi:hypothetical protein
MRETLPYAHIFVFSLQIKPKFLPTSVTAHIPTHRLFGSLGFVFVIFVTNCDCMLQVVRLCAKSREAVSSPVEHLTLHYQVHS